MVFKKPYAFLIKHFRILHIILAVLMSYIAFKVVKIVRFFNNFASSGYYEAVSNIAGSHINLFMYFAVIIILSITVFIYSLMHNKKKDTRFYVATLTYYIIVFVLFSVTFGIMQSLESTTVSAQAARIYRDVSLILSLPQYFFIIFSILRGLGFNLKKFNFQLDLKEMNIETTDNEEIELTVGVETYKAKRYLRRLLREFRYYILENTFIFICIIAIIGIIIGTGIFMNVNVYHKVYGENKVFTYKTFNIKVNDSYITSKNFKGEELTANKYYLVLNINVENKLNGSNKLKLTDFRLKINNTNIYPTKNKMQLFTDLGDPYNEDKIAANSNNNYLLIYELDKDMVRNSYLIKVLDSVEYNIGDIKANYKDVKVRPDNLDDIHTVGTYKMQEKVILKESILKNSTISISGYNITNTYKYNYNFCVDKDNCKESTGIVTPDYTAFSNPTLLILDYDLSLDKDTDYYRNSKTNFFSQFASVRYTKNNKTYISNIKNVTPSELDKKIALQVDSNIKNSNKIDLLITIRNKQYVISIK